MTGALAGLVGTWEVVADLPGAEDVRGRLVAELMGDVLVQRTTVPVPEAPDSCCVVVPNPTAATCSTTSTRGASPGGTR